MPDFFQNGVITALHDLGTVRRAQVELLLEKATRRHRIGLVLPVTGNDLRASPFSQIVRQLAEVEYIDTTIVVLGHAPDVGDYRFAKKQVGPLGDKAEVLWTDGPRMCQLYDRLSGYGYNLADSGKGRAVWTGFGWLLADPRLKAFALHDSDIVGYDRLMLARLCLTMVHPDLNFDFAKAYYVRCTDRLYGRVVRLLMTPLLRALLSIFDKDAFLTYLSSFRYPLSGEFALTSTLASSAQIPNDWGLEVGMLAEAYRNTTLDRICQVDLCAQYEHKHQDLSLDDPSKGLMRMSTDVVATIFRTMGSHGVALKPEHFARLRSAYVRAARKAIGEYHADAKFNGVAYDREDEEAAVVGFAAQIKAAGDAFQPGLSSDTVIPNWARVQKDFPDLFGQLRHVTTADAEFIAETPSLSTPQ